MEINAGVQVARRRKGNGGVVEDEVAAVVEDDSSPSRLVARCQGSALHGSHVEGDVVEGERRGLAALEGIHAALVGGDDVAITVDREGDAIDAEALLSHDIIEELDGVAVVGVSNGIVERRVGLIANLGDRVGDRRLRTCGGLIISGALCCKRDRRSSGDDIRVGLRLIGSLGGRILAWSPRA